MKKAILITYILISLFAVAACASSEIPTPTAPYSTNAPDVDTEESKIDGILNIIPYLNTPEKVYVYRDYNSYKFGGWVYVPASESQSEQIIGLLSDIDMSVFDKAEKAGGIPVDIRLEDSSGGCNIEIFLSIYEADCAYISFDFDNGDSYRFKGDAAAVPFSDLVQATSAVFSDTSDSRHSANVLLLDGSGTSYTLDKGRSASFINILDGTAETSAIYEEAEDYNFDMQISIYDAIYQIDKSSGVFSREIDGEKTIYKLDEGWIMMCNLLLGSPQAS